MSKHFNGFDFTRRIDGNINVWSYMPWPDADLDEEPEVLARYLESTGGWRAFGWQVIHVAESFQSAHDWAYNRTHKGK